MKKSAQQKKTAVKFRGITRHAEQLGVRREHLWLVLTGQRQSRRLTARYTALTGRAS